MFIDYQNNVFVDLSRVTYAKWSPGFREMTLVVDGNIIVLPDSVGQDVWDAVAKYHTPPKIPSFQEIIGPSLKESPDA